MKKLNPDSYIRTEMIVREFLSKYRYLHEERIQKLLFYTELYTIHNYEQQFTNLPWTPGYVGFHSDVLSCILSNVDIESKDTGNKQGIKYIGHYVSETDLTESEKEIIEQVHQYCQQYNTETLTQKIKSTEIYQNSKDGEPVTFEDYIEIVSNTPREYRNFSIK